MRDRIFPSAGRAGFHTKAHAVAGAAARVLLATQSRRHGAAPLVVVVRSLERSAVPEAAIAGLAEDTPLFGQKRQGG